MNRPALLRVKRDESGFTLIELLIVIVILPLVAGAITVVMTTTLTNENAVSSRLTGSTDTELTLAVFVRDVESSSYVTTEGTIVSPYSTQSPQLCGTQGGGTFLVGFYWPSDEATYWYLNGELVRRACAVQSGYSTPSQSSNVTIARSIDSVPVVAIEPQSDLPSLETSWLSTAGVTDVGLNVGVSGQNAYSYALSGTPRVWLPTLAGFNGGGAPPASLLLLNNDRSCTVPALVESGASIVSISHGSAPLAVVTPCAGALQLTGSAALSASSILTADPNMNSLTHGGGVTNYPSTETYESTAIPNPYASLTAPSNPATPLSGSCSAGQCSPGQYTGNLTISGTTEDSFGTGSGTFVFTGPVVIGNSAVVNFLSGTYWFEGGLTVEGDSTVNFKDGTYLFGSSSSGSGNGLLIENSAYACTGTVTTEHVCDDSASALFYIEGGSATISGSGAVSLLAGSEEQGVALWDAAASDMSNPLSIENGSSGTFSLGGVYVPNGEVYVSGAGVLDSSFVAAYTVDVANSGHLTVGS